MRGDDPDRTWIMPKITARAAVLAAVIVLTLTGCAGTPEAAPSEPTQATAATAEQTPEPTVSAAPVEVTQTTAPGSTKASDAELLRVAHAGLDVDGIELTDEEVLAAVAWVCEQRAAGVERPIALEGAADSANYAFQTVAEQMRCPEYFQKH